MHHITTIPERPQTHAQRNDRGRFSQLGDQLFEDHLRLRMALYPAITKFMTAMTGGTGSYMIA